MQCSCIAYTCWLICSFICHLCTCFYFVQSLYYIFIPVMSHSVLTHAILPLVGLKYFTKIGYHICSDTIVNNAITLPSRKDITNRIWHQLGKVLLSTNFSKVFATQKKKSPYFPYSQKSLEVNIQLEVNSSRLHVPISLLLCFQKMNN